MASGACSISQAEITHINHGHFDQVGAYKTVLVSLPLLPITMSLSIHFNIIFIAYRHSRTTDLAVTSFLDAKHSFPAGRIPLHENSENSENSSLFPPRLLTMPSRSRKPDPACIPPPNLRPITSFGPNREDEARELRRRLRELIEENTRKRKAAEREADEAVRTTEGDSGHVSAADQGAKTSVTIAPALKQLPAAAPYLRTKSWARRNALVPTEEPAAKRRRLNSTAGSAPQPNSVDTVVSVTTEEKKVRTEEFVASRSATMRECQRWAQEYRDTHEHWR